MKKKSKPRLYGILGFPLTHTLSPVMQEAGFDNAGIRAFYLALELKPRQLPIFLKRLSRSPFQGLNVTVPYKEAVFRLSPHVTARAKTVKAVNTLIRRKSGWLADNTDVEGFLGSLKREGKTTPRNKKILILGAGGAARAVLCALGENGTHAVWIANRTGSKAKALAREFGKHFRKTNFVAIPFREKEIKEALRQASIVINTTSVGLKSRDRLLLKPAWIPAAKKGKQVLFYDLIYNPPQTGFLKTARQKGHKTLNGLGMLLYQGTAAWESWTGRKAPVSIMRRALLRACHESGESL